MYENLNNELKNLRHKLEEKNKLKARLEKTRKELEEENNKLKDLSSILKKEEEDLSKLEHISPSSIFYSIIGVKDKKIQKEKQEFICAQYNYEVCKGNIEGLKKRIREIYASLEELFNVEVEYEIFLKEKERLIMLNNSGTKTEINKLTNKIQNFKSQVEEVEEVVVTCKNVIIPLNDLINELEIVNKRDDGNFNNNFMNYSKHEKNMREYTKEVIGKLENIKYHLEKIDFNYDLKIDLEGFFIVVDRMLDTVALNWTIKGVIGEILTNSIVLKKAILDLKEGLKNIKINLEKEIEYLNECYKDAIEKG